MKPIFAILAMAAAVTSASAQSGAPTAAQMAQHEVQHYTERLSLTSAQQEEATTIFTAAAASESTMREQQHTAHTALAAAIVSGDTATIGQAATMLGTLEGEMTTARALAEAKLYKILTADQQTTYAAMLTRPMRRGAGGPGGSPPADL